MKTIRMLALLAAGAALTSSTPLCGSEADGRMELSFNKPTAYQLRLSYDAAQIGETTRAPVNEQAAPRLQDEVGDLLASKVRPEAGADPAGFYGPKLQLSAPKPNNIVQSKAHPGIEYSGVFVQAVRNNPLQLLNPLAPVQYGDGEANTVWSTITGRATGLKVLAVHF
jgi:hypothetical protein